MAQRKFHTIENIIVEITPPCLEGALFPRYDRETDYVTLDSLILPPCPYGVNIDNIIILDFNSHRMLASVEIGIPRKLWESNEPPILPATVQEGSLTLANPEIENSNFMIPPEFAVYTTPDRQTGVLRFGKFDTPSILVQLSVACQAIVSASKLVGFLFELPEGARKIRRRQRQER
jgi:hypothetical protein